MDKSTLSNYGWVVIAVLVLSVMIALATPFGTFIADGFKATYTGLFQTGDSALDVGLNAVGVSNKLPCGHGRKEAGNHSQKECGHYNCQDTDCGCVPASCGVEGHWSGDGKDHTTKVNHTNTYYYETPHSYACQCETWIVPDGGIYTRSNGTEYIAGSELPCGKPEGGDVYTYGQYKYTYSTTGISGWVVTLNTAVVDKNQKQYDEILKSVYDKPILSLSRTFENCTSLTTAPTIPDTVINLYWTFKGCTNLKTYVGSTDPDGDFSGFVIPNSVKSMSNTFYECKLMTVAPLIPNSVTAMEGTFADCTSLVVAPVIPENVTDMRNIFFGCSSLTTAPVIPSKVTDIGGAFYGCELLETYHGNKNSIGDFSGYIIPSSIINMKQTFVYCYKITVAPDLSMATNLKYMQSTFFCCTNLSGTITINTNYITNNTDLNNAGSCYSFLRGVDMSKINLTGSASKDVLNLIGSTGKNWTPIE